MSSTAEQISSKEPRRSSRSGSRASFWSSTSIFAWREARTLARNRFLHVFAIVAVAGGLLTTHSAPSAAAIPFILLQLILYLIPLFSILIGLSSAHGELEEQMFLFSQPVPRLAVVIGKAAALLISLALLLFVAFISSFIYAPDKGTILMLWAMAVLLGGVFIALGLAIGFSTRDRARGVIAALLFWLVALIGFDLIAYLTSMAPLMQQQPLLWIGILLINPIDAIRVAVLLRLEDIPFSMATEAPLVDLWLRWIVPWVFAIGLFWIALFLFWSHWQVERREA